ncbi:MAG: hypothetical protein ACREMP_08735 [Candidatus Tyrphobacter sp.]
MGAVRRTALGWACATLAVVVLVLAWIGVFSSASQTSFGMPSLSPAAGGRDAIVGAVTPNLSAAKAGIRPGDVVELSALTLSQRYRLVTGSGPVGSTVTIRVRRGNSTRDVTLREEPHASLHPGQAAAYLTSATIALVIFAVLVLLRPSLATAALVLFGAGFATSFTIADEFASLPDPWFGGVGAAIVAALSILPFFALPVFLTRFPHPPQTRAAFVRMRFADAFFVAGAAVSLYQASFEPIPFASWTFFDSWFNVVPLLVALAFVGAAYADADGEARRRVGWVLAGFVITALAYTGQDIVNSDAIPYSFYETAQTLSSILGLCACALPIALAYAVLRHRVLDFAFALNRTMVYGTMTTLAVAIVLIVGWLAGLLFSEQRWALAIEGFVTIAFGFALNWFQGHAEHLIDRFVFRKRHVAERRIQYRIKALAFAQTTSAVDEALAVDACTVLELRSGAVFGKTSSSGHFRRTLSTGWHAQTADELVTDALLVRTLRSVERPIFLDEAALAPPLFPDGDARPVLAVPVNSEHELIGFALYGNRADGASPDPEEVALLARLAEAAGNAYGAVEARQWRARVAELEALHAAASRVSTT